MEQNDYFEENARSSLFRRPSNKFLGTLLRRSCELFPKDLLENLAYSLSMCFFSR